MSAREHGQKVIGQIDRGRRLATVLLQRIDVGVPVEGAVRELCPGLSPLAVQAAAALANLTAFDFAALSMLLAGLVPDAALAGLEISPAPPRPPRSSPEDLAEMWLTGGPIAPPVPEGDRP